MKKTSKPVFDDQIASIPLANETGFALFSFDTKCFIGNEQNEWIIKLLQVIRDRKKMLNNNNQVDTVAGDKSDIDSPSKLVFKIKLTHS